MNLLLSPAAMVIVTLLAIIYVVAVCAIFAVIGGRKAWKWYKDLKESRKIMELTKDPKWYTVR